MTKKPKVAVIGVGGTITSLSANGPLDIVDYSANPTRLEADEMVEKFSEVKQVAEVIPIRFKSVPSTMVAFPEWKALAASGLTQASRRPDSARRHERPGSGESA